MTSTGTTAAAATAAATATTTIEGEKVLRSRKTQTWAKRITLQMPTNAAGFHVAVVPDAVVVAVVAIAGKRLLPQATTAATTTTISYPKR